MLFTLILAGLMILSIFGIMFSGYASGGEKRPYKDHDFRDTNLGWQVTIDDKQYAFQYHPEDLEELMIEKEISDRLREASVVYVTFNPNTKNVQIFEAAKFGISNFLVERQVYAMPAITEENELYNQELVTCQNATRVVPVIDIRESNVTKVYMEGDCIVLEADRYDVPPLVDRLAYAILGIIE